MNYYYLSKIPNKDGNYEIHSNKCLRHFLNGNRIYLGEFASCEEAFQKAKTYYENVAFCSFCLPKCIPENKAPYEPNGDLFT